MSKILKSGDRVYFTGGDGSREGIIYLCDIDANSFSVLWDDGILQHDLESHNISRVSNEEEFSKVDATRLSDAVERMFKSGMCLRTVKWIEGYTAEIFERDEELLERGFGRTPAAAIDDLAKRIKGRKDASPTD